MDMSVFGPMYYNIFKTLPCIYSTFAKAKSMAMSIQYVTSDIGKMPPLPLDNKGLALLPHLKCCNSKNISMVCYRFSLRLYGPGWCKKQVYASSDRR